MTTLRISILAACVAGMVSTAPAAETTDRGERPVRLGGLPGGASYAYEPDRRESIPEVRHADGSLLTPVLVRPLVPERYPEELEARAAFDSPDPEPAGIAFDGERLWVCGRRTRRIHLLDPATGEVGESMPSPGSDPTGLAWDGTRMWHTDARARRLHAIEGGKVVREVQLAWHPTGVAVTSEGLVIGERDSDGFRLVDPSTGKVQRRLDAPARGVQVLVADRGRIWCAHGDGLIVEDRERSLPVASFSLAGRRPDAVSVAGVEIVGDALWYSDRRGARILRIDKPRHGQRIAAHGHTRGATFSMQIRNTGPADWEPFELLWNVAIYEMPGQRFQTYEIRPEPVAHYLDADGNLHALMRKERVRRGETFSIRATARLWSADRWTFLDPDECTGEVPPPWDRTFEPGFPRPRPLTHPSVQSFLRESVGKETNPYWRLRAAHDALIDQVVYAPPPDESVPGVLRTGKGVCRNLGACLETLGRAARVPVLDAWAPRHNLVVAYLPGAGWAFIEVTENNQGETTGRRRRSRWFGGLPGRQLTTGVHGPGIAQTVTVDGRLLVNKRHCRLAAGLKGFRETDRWTNTAVADPRR